MPGEEPVRAPLVGETLEPLEMASGWFQSAASSQTNPDWVGSTLGVNVISALTNGSPSTKSSLSWVLGAPVSVRLRVSPCPTFSTAVSSANTAGCSDAGATSPSQVLMTNKTTRPTACAWLRLPAMVYGGR